MPAKNKPLTETQLAVYESKRDLAADLLRSVREMQAGKVHVVSLAKPIGKIPPCGRLCTPFGRLCTPFGRLCTPFGRLCTPFGRLCTPFGRTDRRVWACSSPVETAGSVVSSAARNPSRSKRTKGAKLVLSQAAQHTGVKKFEPGLFSFMRPNANQTKLLTREAGLMQ